MPGLDHDKWAVQAVKEARVNLLQAPGLRPPGWGDAALGDAALHHQISKVTLERIGTDLDTAMRSRSDPDLPDAARAFWKAVQRATPQQVHEQTRQSPFPIVKTLWNLPLNLELGPALYEDNPGIGFDPNSEPDPDRSNGYRRLTTDAANLQRIEDLYWATQSQGRDPEPEDWMQMTTALVLAAEAYEARAEGLLLARPLTEQWTGDTPPAPQPTRWWFQRKRLRRFLGREEGLNRFQNARRAPEPLPAVDAAHAVPPYQVAQVVFTGADGSSKQAALEVRFTTESLRHCCQRHTYRHFDFGQIKVVNTFWPVTVESGVEETTTEARRAIQAIGQAVEQYLVNGGIPPQEWAEDQELKGVVPLLEGAGSVFFFAQIGVNDEMDTWVAVVETIAPDAHVGEAYTAAELRQIGRDLGVL